MKAKKNDLEKIKLSLLDFRSKGFLRFTLITTSNDICILPGPDNQLSCVLLDFVCSLARVYGFRYFVAISCSLKPYILIFFPSR